MPLKGVPVRSRSRAPHRNGLCSVPIFLCRKISHTRRCSSFFAKRHVCVGYSLASALITPLAHYHLFARNASAAHGHLFCSREPRRNGLCSVPIFLCRKISHALRRSSSFVKSHAQFACSFVNALATAHNRYQLFTILRLRRSQNPMSLLRLPASPVRTLYFL